jgi:hypothetical protein
MTTSDVPDWMNRYHGREGRRGEGKQEGAEMIEISGEIRGATEKAVNFYDGRQTVWLPRSQVRETDGGLLVPQWLAKKNGLI